MGGIDEANRRSLAMAGEQPLKHSIQSDWKSVLQMAWPLIIANSFWNLQMTIDRIFLGAYSTKALAAALSVMGVFWVPMALLQQTAMYVTTFVAQYYGAKEYSKISKAFWQAIYVSLIGGILFLGLNGFSGPFFHWVGHSDAIQVLEQSYFNSIAFAALPTAMVGAISGYFTGLGSTQTVIWINFVGLFLNAILDYLFIFGHGGFPPMGIAGAGYATAIGTYGSAIYGFWILSRSTAKTSICIGEGRSFDWRLMKRFLKYGLPSGFQWALEGLAFTIFLIAMGHLKNGDAALASSSIAITVMMLSVLPALGIAQAVMTLVGQSLGENNPELAEKVTWSGVKISAVYIFIAGLSFVLFPTFYLSWFTNYENPELWKEVCEITPGILKIIAVFTMLDSIYLNFSFALKGAGDTKYVSLLALILPWPFMVIPAWLMRNLDHAVFYAWCCAAIYSLSITSMLFLRFQSGKWKAMRVIEVED